MFIKKKINKLTIPKNIFLLLCLQKETPEGAIKACVATSDKQKPRFFEAPKLIMIQKLFIVIQQRFAYFTDLAGKSQSK